MQIKKGDFLIISKPPQQVRDEDMMIKIPSKYNNKSFEVIESVGDVTVLKEVGKNYIDIVNDNFLEDAHVISRDLAFEISNSLDFQRRDYYESEGFRDYMAAMHHFDEGDEDDNQN